MQAAPTDRIIGEVDTAAARKQVQAGCLELVEGEEQQEQAEQP
jgi:hypothetical protein